MWSRPYNTWRTPRKMGDNFFALGTLYCGAPLWGGVIWGKSFLVLGGGRGLFRVLVVSIHLNENLFVVDIKFTHGI